MKSIIVISDSHNNRNSIIKLIPVIEESDYVITLGDMFNDYFILKSKFSDKLISVKGNCDSFLDLEIDKVIQIEQVKLFITHGHIYSVKSNTDKLLDKAKDNNCNVALFGHTHKATVKDIDDIKLINPGSMSYYSRKSYCYMVIAGNKVYAKTVFV